MVLDRFIMPCIRCNYATHDWKRVTVAMYPFFITC